MKYIPMDKAPGLVQDFGQSLEAIAANTRICLEPHKPKWQQNSEGSLTYAVAWVPTDLKAAIVANDGREIDRRFTYYFPAELSFEQVECSGYIQSTNPWAFAIKKDWCLDLMGEANQVRVHEPLKDYGKVFTELLECCPDASADILLRYLSRDRIDVLPYNDLRKARDEIRALGDLARSRKETAGEKYAKAEDDKNRNNNQETRKALDDATAEYNKESAETRAYLSLSSNLTHMMKNRKDTNTSTLPGILSRVEFVPERLLEYAGENPTLVVGLYTDDRFIMNHPEFKRIPFVEKQLTGFLRDIEDGTVGKKIVPSFYATDNLDTVVGVLSPEKSFWQNLKEVFGSKTL